MDRQVPMNAARIIALAAYIAALVAIALYSSRRTRNISDFLLANRSIGPWVSALAYGTTYFSAVLFVGYAGRIGWSYGLGGLWIVVGNALVGTLLPWLLLAAPTRELTTRLGAMTMPELFRSLYGSEVLLKVAAVITFLFLLPYSASVYMGLSYLFEKVLGIDYSLALTLMAILTGFYLVFGGYLAIAMVDFLQGLIMVAGSLLLVIFVVSRASTHTGSAIGEALWMVSSVSVQQAPHSPPAWLGLLSLVVLTSLGPMGLPQMVQKFYSIRSADTARRAMVVSTVFATICTFGAYFSGAFTRVFFTAEQVKELGADNLMPTMVNQYLPQGLAIIIMLVVLSASMSTLSSLVLISSSSVVVDLMGGERRLGARGSTLLMRILCAIFVGLSLLIALKPWSFIVNMMSISWGTLTGAFIAPYLYGLFWKRADATGAWASLISGVTCSLGLSLGLSLWWCSKAGQPFSLNTPWIPFAGSVSMLLPLAVFPLASMIREKWEKFTRPR